MARSRTKMNSQLTSARVSEYSTKQLSERDRKSTRLNSSHSQISYAVFCLKKKKNHHTQGQMTINERGTAWTVRSFSGPVPYSEQCRRTSELSGSVHSCTKMAELIPPDART